MSPAKVAVLIPAYKPSGELLHMLGELLRDPGLLPVVVNDGSGAAYDRIFAEIPAGVAFTAHEINCGKGRALKTGLRFIFDNFPDCVGVVTADADGQHLPSDIRRVADEFLAHPDALILGSRRFAGDVPFRSKFGNTLTRGVFFAASGVRLRDTQTGLRAFSFQEIPELMEIEGNRYEYEINMLLHCAKRKTQIREVDIETVYINDNSSSHFKAVRDSALIYSCILKYTAASLISFAVDFALLYVFLRLSPFEGEESSLLFAAVCARISSSSVNFTLNRLIVFKSQKRLAADAAKYYALVAAILAANYCFLWFFNLFLRLPLGLSKTITEILLYIISYAVQKRLIFNKSEHGEEFLSNDRKHTKKRE